MRLMKSINRIISANAFTARTGAFFACRRGQILIPSLLIIPSLLLFIYLLFETAKISREKIRQQFAVDTAAFVQMVDYTNIFNRTAYVNGAFPYRIFKEMYECTEGCVTGKEENCIKRTDETGVICSYKLLYDAGVIPKFKDDQEGKEAVSLDSNPNWEIAYNDKLRPDINKNPPKLDDQLTLITYDNSIKMWIFWDAAVGIYQFYAQVYGLLGKVEESQLSVFEKITENFNFFRKAYYLNAATAECTAQPDSCGEDGIRSPGGFRDNKFMRGKDMMMHYIKEIKFFAKVPQEGQMPPYYAGETNPPIKMDDPGLFQMATFSDEVLKNVGRGYEVFQGWSAPENYFKVNFNELAACKETGRPCVHSMVASQCPRLGSDNNCVWPNPTPKYQTRLYP